ncbi:MAG TPA: substrate-binding domain-containing protein [Flavisolibacter sp.]|nr:substrate-binding domain-containing protein [Flavisolibacter sp.]
MEKRVSLKDIARAVGVSTALVSYVLNNQKENRIGKEVAQKIREAAKALNYRPNHIAKSLKTRKTHTLGLIVADIANPFFSTLARIIEDEAEKAGYSVIFASSDEKAERSQKLTEILLDRQVDGIILAPAEDTEAHIKSLQEKGVPMVLIDRYFPGLSLGTVVVDNYAAAYQCAAHLVKAGYQRVGMIGFQTKLLHLQDRKRGFINALNDLGVTATNGQIREISLEASREEVESAMTHLLSGPQPVDALFFASNKLSTCGVKYINALPLQVPEDLGICSFDESEATELFYVSLTHVRQPLQEMGKQAVRLLLQRMDKEKKIEQLQLSAELVAGKSTRREQSQ